MASEPSTSRLPEEVSSDMDSDSDTEVPQVNIDSHISTSIRSSTSAKKRSCVYRREYAKTFPWATTSRKGSSFAFCMKCSRDLNLGRGGTRDPGDIRKWNYTNTQKKMVWVYCLYCHKKMVWCTASTVLLWANKRGVCNLVQKYSSHISLESTILPINWEIIVPNYSSWCFLILLLLKT